MTPSIAPSAQEAKRRARVDGVRWAFIVAGFVGAKAVLLATPHEGVEPFPVGALLIFGLALSVLLVLFGMLYDHQEGSMAPLLGGALGCAWFAAFLFTDHGVSPNWLVVVGVLAIASFRPAIRAVFRLVFNRR